jgi:hypothetical protein
VVVISFAPLVQERRQACDIVPADRPWLLSGRIIEMGSLPHNAAAFAADSNAVLKFITEDHHNVDKYPIHAGNLEPGHLHA